MKLLENIDSCKKKTQPHLPPKFGLREDMLEKVLTTRIGKMDSYGLDGILCLCPKAVFYSFRNHGGRGGHSPIDT